MRSKNLAALAVALFSCFLFLSSFVKLNSSFIFSIFIFFLLFCLSFFEFSEKFFLLEIKSELIYFLKRKDCLFASNWIFLIWEIAMNKTENFKCNNEDNIEDLIRREMEIDNIIKNQTRNESRLPYRERRKLALKQLNKSEPKKDLDIIKNEYLYTCSL